MYTTFADNSEKSENKCQVCENLLPTTSQKQRKYCSPKCARHAEQLRRQPNRNVTVKFKIEEDKDKKYYVYGWFDGDDVFYIGCGSKKRVTDPTRTERVKRIVNLSTNFQIKILADKLNKQDARRIEANLIDAFQPIGNKNLKGVSLNTSQWE